MYDRWVIAHKRDGLFTFTFDGDWTFSLRGTGGQICVPAYVTSGQAEYMARSMNIHPIDEYSFYPVRCEDSFSATTKELEMAGLTHLLGEMRRNGWIHELKNMNPTGRPN
jgi:hypothetical protein